MALPVSCASTRRCSGVARQRLGGVQPHRRAVGHALRVDRDRAARRQRHALRAARAERRVGQRLLAEEDDARVAPQHLVHALRVAPRPVLDGRPGGAVGLELALVDEPAADRRVGLVVVAGVGQPHRLRAAIAALEAQPARALDLQHQRIQRVGDVGDLAPAQRGLRRRQRVELLARPVGLARRQVGGRRVQRHLVGAARACGWPRSAARSSR